MAKSRSGRSEKRRFTGNRYTIRATINENDETSELNSTESASAKKLESSHTSLEIFSERLFETSKDNRIVSWTTLISFFAIVCCPDCYSQGLELIEDSVSGLCSHMNLKIIGKGFSAGKKLCAFLGLPFLSKLAFRNQERKLLKATERVAQENINAALSEIKGSNSFTKCGISIDGTWQRRGYSSLNGCGLGSNPGEDMDAYKCIVPSRHGVTLNTRRAESPLVRLVEGEEREYNLTPSVVRNLRKQYQDTGSIERKPGQRQTRATTAREDRHLSIITRRNKGVTASQLSGYLYAASGTRVSRVTVSKRLHERGLFARRLTVCASGVTENNWDPPRKVRSWGPKPDIYVGL
ncbi:CCHC-type domain-containing protein [Trichonephila clavipes]|nr:CCHC-type domain-containing protein [Trichonephila clavipes]